MNNIDSTLRRIKFQSSSLSLDDQEVLTKILNSLLLIINESERTDFASDELKRVEKYLSRPKSLGMSKSLRASSLELLDIARSNAHGKWRFSTDELRKLQPVFWKALEANSDVWGPEELSNLLSYSLRKRIRFDVDSDESPRYVARAYHSGFKSLNTIERDELFEELLQRILSEPQFRRALARSAQER